MGWIARDYLAASGCMEDATLPPFLREDATLPPHQGQRAQCEHHGRCRWWLDDPGFTVHAAAKHLHLPQRPPSSGLRRAGRVEVNIAGQVLAHAVLTLEPMASHALTRRWPRNAARSPRSAAISAPHASEGGRCRGVSKQIKTHLSAGRPPVAVAWIAQPWPVHGVSHHSAADCGGLARCRLSDRA